MNIHKNGESSGNYGVPKDRLNFTIARNVHCSSTDIIEFDLPETWLEQLGDLRLAGLSGSLTLSPVLNLNKGGRFTDEVSDLPVVQNNNCCLIRSNE